MQSAEEGEKIGAFPPSFFQLTIWKALIKLHIFYYVGITSELLTRKLYLLSPVAWEREKRGKKENQESREDEMANQQKRTGKKKEKTSMIEKETRKGERMGELDRKLETGRRRWGGKHPQERAVPAGVSGWGL